MAFISNVLQAKHQEMVIAKEIMDSLEGMFAKVTRQARQAAVCSIMIAQMKKGTKV